MFESLDKLMLAGLGAISMTRERAEKIFEEYVQRGQIEKDRRTGFVRDVMDAAAKTRKELEDLVGKQVQETLTRLDMPRREDLARLEAKLDELLAKREK